MAEGFRGVFSIAQTPFDEKGGFLWDDFERQCDWIVRAGAHGLVWPVMASEYTVISYPERVQGMRIAVQAVSLSLLPYRLKVSASRSCTMRMPFHSFSSVMPAI